jgi:ABC-type antimicrobial peptide transport system permease subunit
VPAYLVGQSRKEIGIRLAPGASTRVVFGLGMREGLIVTAVGMSLGAVGV